MTTNLTMRTAAREFPHVLTATFHATADFEGGLRAPRAPAAAGGSKKTKKKKKAKGPVVKAAPTLLEMFLALDDLQLYKKGSDANKRKTTFRSWDANGNGYLSLAEVDRELRSALEKKYPEQGTALHREFKLYSTDPTQLPCAMCQLSLYSLSPLLLCVQPFIGSSSCKAQTKHNSIPLCNVPLSPLLPVSLAPVCVSCAAACCCRAAVQ